MHFDCKRNKIESLILFNFACARTARCAMDDSSSEIFAHLLPLKLKRSRSLSISRCVYLTSYLQLAREYRYSCDTRIRIVCPYFCCIFVLYLVRCKCVCVASKCTWFGFGCAKSQDKRDTWTAWIHPLVLREMNKCFFFFVLKMFCRGRRSTTPPRPSLALYRAVLKCVARRTIPSTQNHSMASYFSCPFSSIRYYIYIVGCDCVCCALFINCRHTTNRDINFYCGLRFIHSISIASKMKWMHVLVAWCFRTWRERGYRGD